MDEKWSFVLKKQDDCDLQQSADPSANRLSSPTCGECWDHVAFDPEHRLVLGVVFGKRSATHILTLLKQVKMQLQDRVPRLVTSDQFASYATVLKQVWPDGSRPPRPDKRCTRRRRHMRQKTMPDPALNYATAAKQRQAGRVVRVDKTVVFGTTRSVAAALRESTVSHTINTSFLERHNGTDRHRNAPKVRRSYRFSKDWLIHHAVGYFTMYSYNFCWCVRTLARPTHNASGPRRSSAHTPAMVAGLTDHVWSLREWLQYPIAALAT